MVDMFHCFTEQITWRKSGELGTGGDPAGNLYIVWTNYNYKIADERRSKKEKEQSNLEEKNAYEEKINKQIDTCSQYGFVKGSDPFMQCINDLMSLDLEFAKLKNEELMLQAKLEEAKANNEADLINQIQMQSLLSQQNQLIEMQNFNDGMGLLMNSLDMLGGSTYEQPAFTPIITCREFNNTTTCY